MENNYTQQHLHLITDCISGDRKSQKELYDLFAPKMFAICLRFTKNSEDAEDILQESFIKLFNNLHKYRGEGNFGGWVRRIFVNTCIEHIRRKKIDVPISDAIEVSFFDHQKSALEKLYEQDVHKVLNDLSDGYRTVFNLYAIEGYTHKEIADMLGISENTSKSQYCRAKASLRKQFKRAA